MGFIEELKSKVSTQCPSIVFPEGEDKRILGARVRLKEEKILAPVVLGNIDEIEKTAQEKDLNIDDLAVIDSLNYDDIDALADVFVERHKGKIGKEGALGVLKNPNYFGILLIYTGRATGTVSGVVRTTGETVKPALQIIKTKEGFKRTSGLFVMLREDEQYLMSDYAINLEMGAPTMAEVAVITDMIGRQFGMDPHVVMLSFSTRESAKSGEVTMVQEATVLAKENHPEIKIDGELQFDAAFVDTITKKKAPGSPVAGCTNTFVFPNLATGNIGHKIAQRFGGFEAIGPILQGLNRPVNDSSKECNEDEVYLLSIITAAQAVL